MSAFRHFRRGSSFGTPLRTRTPAAAASIPVDAPVGSETDASQEPTSSFQESFKQELKILGDRIEDILRQELHNFRHQPAKDVADSAVISQAISQAGDNATLASQPELEKSTNSAPLNSSFVEGTIEKRIDVSAPLGWVMRRNSHVAYEDAQEENANVRKKSKETYTPLLPTIENGTLPRSDGNLPRSDGKTQHAGQIYQMLPHAAPRDSYRISYRGPCVLLRSVVHSAQFDFLCSFAILVNATIIGVQVDYMARRLTEDTPYFFQLTENIFCGIFTIEVMLRNIFECTPGFWWNIFDCGVVGIQLSEVIVELCSHLTNNFSQKAGILRIIRIFRTIRIFRSLRVFHLLAGLRMLVVSIYDSVRSLAWTFVLLFLMIYVLAVFITQVVTYGRIQHPRFEEQNDLLSELYGSVDRSLISLFKTVSEGIHWGEIAEPLVTFCSPWFTLVFVIHMGFMLFAVLNVVTGVFVELAIRKANEDEKRILLRQMRELFQDVEDSTGGVITADNFQKCIDAPGMQAYLSAIDLDPQDARQLFGLLDVDGLGEIETEELVTSCLRLHGPAKAIELAAFICEYRRWSQRWTAHAKKVEASLDALHQNAARIHNS